MPSTVPTSPLYAKVTDELTLPLPPAEAVALCRAAVDGDRRFHVKEGEDRRLLVKYIPGGGKNAKIEVLFGDSGGSATTVTLNGWFFGMGKSQLRKAVERLHAAIDEQQQQSTTAP